MNKLDTVFLKIKPYQAILIPVCVALVTSLVVVKCASSPNENILKQLASNESVYARVMRSGTIRCGYSVSPPSVIKNVDNEKLSGLSYDYMQEIGKILNLKVEFVRELNVAEYQSALNSNQIDVMCSGVNVSAARGKFTDFIDPIFYSPNYFFARANDNRFDKGISIANNPKYSLIHIEGTVTELIQKHLFPESKSLELPRLARTPELFMSLAAGEGDFIIADKYNFKEFDSRNPGKIKMVDPKPVMIFPRSIAIKNGQDEMRTMLNYATEQLRFSGVIDKLIDKYEKYPNVYYRVSPGYITEAKSVAPKR